MEYTPQFWKRAIELAMTQPKTCEKCQFQEGWTNPDAGKKIPLVVRVALRDGEKLHSSNLGLFCVRCRRGKYQVKVKKADLEKLVLPLFSNKEWSY